MRRELKGIPIILLSSELEGIWSYIQVTALVAKINERRDNEVTKRWKMIKNFDFHDDDQFWLQGPKTDQAVMVAVGLLCLLISAGLIAYSIMATYSWVIPFTTLE